MLVARVIVCFGHLTFDVQRLGQPHGGAARKRAIEIA
jgi:hypothetical protein